MPSTTCAGRGVEIGGSFTVSVADAVNESDVGAKARNLARLLRLGIRVPPAVVVRSTALETFLDAADLRGPIATACERLDAKSLLAIRCASETISALMHEYSLPDGLRTALDSSVACLRADALIVRSSAIGEDSDAASFAGQLDSIADVVPGPDCYRALIDVWASRWSARALAYERARNATLRGVAVIVQQQIKSVLSGVIFTVAPHDRFEMVVEYCAGMGDALVSGRENPGRLTIRRTGLSWTRSVGADSPIANEALLNDSCIRTLARTALKIEEEFGQPQDIEWTLDASGMLWFVQSRPITVQTPNPGPRPPTHGTRELSNYRTTGRDFGSSGSNPRSRPSTAAG